MNHRSSTNSSAFVPEQSGAVEPPPIGGRPFVPEQVGRVDPDEWFDQLAGAEPDPVLPPRPAGPRTPRRMSDGDGHELFTHVAVPTQRVPASALRPGTPGPAPAVSERTERIPLRRLLTGEPAAPAESTPAGRAAPVPTPAEPAAAGPTPAGPAAPGSAAAEPAEPTRAGRAAPGPAAAEPPASGRSGSIGRFARDGAPPVGAPGTASRADGGRDSGAGTASGSPSVEQARPAQPAGERPAQPAGERPARPAGQAPAKRPRRGKPAGGPPKRGRTRRANRGTGAVSTRSRRKLLVPVIAGALLAAAVALLSAGFTGTLVSGGADDTQTLSAAAPAALDPAQASGQPPAAQAPAGVPGLAALPGPAGVPDPAAQAPAGVPGPAALPGPAGVPDPAALPGPAGPAAVPGPGTAATTPATPGAAKPATPGFAAPAPAAQRTPTAAGPAAPAPAAAARMIMIIRHGEKPDDTPDEGGDTAGNPDDHSLTPRGWTRARSLSKLFAPTGAARPGIAQPTVIYAAGPTGEGTGRRTRETVSPLAGKLGVPVNTSFGEGQEAALVRSAVAQSRKGPVLIAWQHGEIPAIAAGLKVVGAQPPTSWPDSRYDMVWTFTQAGPDTWRFSQTPQLLLAGDSGSPIR